MNERTQARTHTRFKSYTRNQPLGQSKIITGSMTISLQSKRVRFGCVYWFSSFSLFVYVKPKRKTYKTFYSLTILLFLIILFPFKNSVQLISLRLLNQQTGVCHRVQQELLTNFLSKWETHFNLSEHCQTKNRTRNINSFLLVES